MNSTGGNSRRDFLKKGGIYVAPLILTLVAVPAFAGSGSGYTSHGPPGGGPPGGGPPGGGPPGGGHDVG